MAPDRVWSLQELGILQDMTRPIAIIVNGAYEDPHCEGGMRYMSRVVMYNAECLRRFGAPRSQAAYSSAMSGLTEEARKARRKWLTGVSQGWEFRQTLPDVHELLRPVFSAVPDGPCVAKIESKPIRVQTTPIMVDTAIMHIMDHTACTNELRVSAMHDVNPLHMFMFSNQGLVLNMNQAASEACRYSGLMDSGPQGISMKMLFDSGDYPGGEEEAEAAYDEAFHAIFHLQLQRHRHTQPYISKKDGKSKWVMIEMSPITDPVDGSPAVLVQRYNITQQKQLELQLSLQQEALQRHNQELEQDALATEQEKAKLQQEADSLAQQLEAVLLDKFATSGTSFDADTPIDKTMKFLQSIIMGGAPKVQAALELYSILSESNIDLRQPVGLEEQLLKDEALDSEVGQSMLQLLQGNTPTSKSGPRRSLDFESRTSSHHPSSLSSVYPPDPSSHPPHPAHGTPALSPAPSPLGKAADPKGKAALSDTSPANTHAAVASHDIYAASAACEAASAEPSVSKSLQGIGALSIKISPAAAASAPSPAVPSTSSAAPTISTASASPSATAAASTSGLATSSAAVRPSEDGWEKSAGSSTRGGGAAGPSSAVAPSNLGAATPAGQVESVPPPITPDIERRLKEAESSWTFDIFGFADATTGYSLSLLFCHLVSRAGLVQELGIDEAKLIHYARRIEKGYVSTNPYHNSVHVASVVQMTHMLLCHGGVMKSQALSMRQQMATYFSALVHDFEHGGVNNDFLIKTLHPLAITYNDQSPLENHHHAAAVRLLLQPEYRYLPAISASRFAESMSDIRFMCISQVLGTDMKKHFDISSRFQAAFKRPAGNDVSSPVCSPQCALDWDTIKAEDKTLVHQMVLKCADIGHLAASPRTHRRWAFQLEEEFFRQGDKERAAGLGVSPLMDRTQQGGMTRSQMGFFTIVGIPLFKAMTDLFEDAKPMLDGVLANFHHWESNTDLADLPA